jgi:hypothetical protein
MWQVLAQRQSGLLWARSDVRDAQVCVPWLPEVDDLSAVRNLSACVREVDASPHFWLTNDDAVRLRGCFVSEGERLNDGGVLYPDEPSLALHAIDHGGIKAEALTFDRSHRLFEPILQLQVLIGALQFAARHSIPRHPNSRACARRAFTDER